MSPHLTPTERVAWELCPVARYGEDVVATFRAWLDQNADREFAAGLRRDACGPAKVTHEDCEAP